MRTLLILVIISGCASVSHTPVRQHTGSAMDLAPAFDSITSDELLAHIQVLASDEFEGRAPGTLGEQLTVDYITHHLRSAGLSPGNPDGSFVQKVHLAGYTSRPAMSIAFAATDRQFGYPEEYVARSRSMVPEVSIESSEVVFVGYGIEAPEFGWDDYGGVDLRGKTLLMLEGEPHKTMPREHEGPPEPRFRKTASYYGTRHYKYEAAARKGAAAVFLIHIPDRSWVTFPQLQARFERESFDLLPEQLSERTAVDGWITSATFERIAADAGLSAATLIESAANADFTPVPLNATVSIDVRTQLRTFDSHNVVARLEGSDPQLKDEHVIYSAHWDHLGRDAASDGDQIHNGAIDNAAGIAQLLEIAEGFAALETAPRRSFLFIATTGEEVGFLGATYYVTHPLQPIGNAVANINLDAGNVWGRTTDVANLGYGLTSLDGVLAAAARRQDRTFIEEPFAGGHYFFLSDQFMFARAGVPSVFPSAGETYIDQPADFGAKKWAEYGTRYHTVTDEIEPDWDLDGAAEDARWLLDVGYAVAQDDAAPTWNHGLEFTRRGMSAVDR